MPALQPCLAQREHPYSLNVSVLHESYSLPTSGIAGIKVPVHPGIRAGTEFYYGAGGRSGFFQNISLTYYFHRTFHHSFTLSTQFGYRYMHRSGFFTDLSLGTGYMYLLLNQQVYKPKSNGEFTPVKQAGLHRLISSLALSAGHKISLSGRTFYPYLKYEIMGESPFNKDTPLVPHILLQSGVIFPMHQKPQQ
jgi:hypothetical protein